MLNNFISNNKNLESVSNMKSQKYQRLISFFVFILIVTSFFTGVLASSTIETITAQINHNIKIIINGKTLKPVDTDGKTNLDPILYKGRTYLPLKVIGEELKLAIDWNNATQTIVLGGKNYSTPLTDIEVISKKEVDITKAPELLTVTTKTDLGQDEKTVYKYGIIPKDEAFTNNHGTIQYKLNKKFSKLFFKGYSVADNLKIIVKDNDTGMTLSETTFKAGEFKDVTVDVTQVANLLIQFAGPEYDLYGYQITDQIRMIEPNLK